MHCKKKKTIIRPRGVPVHMAFPGKQEIKPLLLHQLPFLSLALAAAEQSIPQNFMDGDTSFVERD